MQYVFVLSKNGSQLMPTTCAHARKLLHSGRAVIEKHEPFAIRLNHDASGIQPVEYKTDTGAVHVGVSVCSAKHEYVHEQYDMPADEKQHHDDCRKYRRARRNRLRYRKPRFNNRRKPEGWLAPTNQHKLDMQKRLFEKYASVCPVTDADFEVGKFDVSAITAIEQTGVKPSGTDYQHGYRYQMAALRDAVFYRDGYTCQVCGKSIGDEAVLRVHHIGFRTGDHTDRMGNLLTVCTKCHTSKNHKPGGKLWGLKPKTSNLSGTAFMNNVRWKLVNEMKAEYPAVHFHAVYGSDTKVRRHDRNIAKSHANDAYVPGTLIPKHRTQECLYTKHRRNNRILSKFYDAKYIDIRDNTTKSGSQLSCGRTDRSETRCSEKNERLYRGRQVRKGRVSIRKQHYPYQPGDIVNYRGIHAVVKGTHCAGSRVMLETGKSVAVKAVAPVRKIGGWQFLPGLCAGTH
ncbi:MAG: RNA-guided endonuclease IscB [Bulleidia sp.]|nr:RNA-guided endonuclease IscB [Bulleidia sp.]